MADAFSVRIRLLAEEARRKRRDWVLETWTDSPAYISKDDVAAAAAAAASNKELHEGVDEIPGWLPLRNAITELAGLMDRLEHLHGSDAARDSGAGAVLAAAAIQQQRHSARGATDTAGLLDLHLQRATAPAVPATAALDTPINESPVVRSAVHPFLRQLLQPEAADVVELIRSFVRSFEDLDIAAIEGELPDPDPDYDFDMEENGGPGSRGSAHRRAPPSKRATVQSPSERVRAFLTRTEETMRVHPVWKRAPAADGSTIAPLGGAPGVAPDSSSSVEAQHAALEKLLCGKLYAKVFGMHPKAAARDAFLAQRLRSLSFVSFKNLDIPEPPSHLLPLWRAAQASLRHMDDCDSPGDKLACIMNSSRIIGSCLSLAAAAAAAQASGGDDAGGAPAPKRAPAAVGADDFLPALIYTVLHACPPRLYSNLHFIGEHCRPSILMSEAGYYYTQVMSAVAFSRNVRPEHLSMSREEFDASMASAVADASARTRQEIDRGVVATQSALAMGGFSESERSSLSAASAAAGTSAPPVTPAPSDGSSAGGEAEDPGGGDVDPLLLEAGGATAARMSLATAGPEVVAAAAQRPAMAAPISVEQLLADHDARMRQVDLALRSGPQRPMTGGGFAQWPSFGVSVPAAPLRSIGSDGVLADKPLDAVGVVSDYLQAAEDALQALLAALGSLQGGSE